MVLGNVPLEGCCMGTFVDVFTLMPTPEAAMQQSQRLLQVSIASALRSLSSNCSYIQSACRSYTQSACRSLRFETSWLQALQLHKLACLYDLVHHLWRFCQDGSFNGKYMRCLLQQSVLSCLLHVCAVPSRLHCHSCKMYLGTFWGNWVKPWLPACWMSSTRVRHCYSLSTWPRSRDRELCPGAPQVMYCHVYIRVCLQKLEI